MCTGMCESGFRLHPRMNFCSAVFFDFLFDCDTALTFRFHVIIKKYWLEEMRRKDDKEKMEEMCQHKLARMIKNVHHG